MGLCEYIESKKIFVMVYVIYDQLENSG